MQKFNKSRMPLVSPHVVQKPYIFRAWLSDWLDHPYGQMLNMVDLGNLFLAAFIASRVLSRYTFPTRSILITFESIELLVASGKKKYNRVL